MTTMTKSVRQNSALIQVLPFLNNPKDLDPSFKMDLDFSDCFGRKKNLCLIIKEIWILLSVSLAQVEMMPTKYAASSVRN